MVKITFRLNEQRDEDICAALSDLPGDKKSDFIRNAIRFYINMGQIDQRLENIERSLADIAQNGLVVSTDAPKAKPADLSPAKKKIFNGIDDILNM
jgi:Arc/MetJ-type ribon-helix-helix transcriptional regulator